MGVPATLLKKMYVSGSLRNTPQGFRFTLKNRIAPATIIRFDEVHAMGRAFGPEHIFIHIGSKTYPAAEISERRNVCFHVNDVMDVEVRGFHLPPGEHILTCRMYVHEVGWLRVPVEDVVLPVQESDSSWIPEAVAV